MPAKKLITKQILLNAAFNIVKERGVGCLNIRAVAKSCNCSTQPVYLSFSGIEEIKKEVAKMALDSFNKCIEGVIASGRYPEYKAVGMGYVKFAREEKNLFKFIFMNDGKVKTGEDESFNKSVYMLMKNYGLYEDEARKLHAEMWIFVHGFATMYATEYFNWDWKTVECMLTDVYCGLTSSLRGNKNDN